MKHPRFQFHIGTAILLTIAAGILVFANVRSTSVNHETHLALSERHNFGQQRTYGWPLVYLNCYERLGHEFADRPDFEERRVEAFRLPEIKSVFDELRYEETDKFSDWFIVKLAADVLLAIGLLALAGLLSERLVYPRR